MKIKRLESLISKFNDVRISKLPKLDARINMLPPISSNTEQDTRSPNQSSKPLPNFGMVKQPSFSCYKSSTAILSSSPSIDNISMNKRTRCESRNQTQIAPFKTLDGNRNNEDTPELNEYFVVNKLKFQKKFGRRGSDGGVVMEIKPNLLESYSHINLHSLWAPKNPTSDSLSLDLKTSFDAALLNFMSKISASPRKDLFLNSASRSQSKILGLYMPGIIKLCLSTNNKVYLTDLILTQKQFKRIFEA